MSEQIITTKSGIHCIKCPYCDGLWIHKFTKEHYVKCPHCEEVVTVKLEAENDKVIQ